MIPARIMVHRAIGWFGVIAAALLIGSCGGGSDNESADILTRLAAVGGTGCAQNTQCVAPRSTTPAGDVQVAAVEIAEKGLLLTASGQLRQLTARVYDTRGEIQPVTVAWVSSRPEVISVGSDGVAVAGTQDGATQIVAQVAGVRSAPLLALATQPAPGALLVDDAAVLGDPVDTDPNALPNIGNTYRILLAAPTAPPVGTLMIGTGSKAVGGEVVGVQSTGTTHTVTLRVVALRQLFPTLRLEEVIDIAAAPITFNPNVVTDYQIERVGNRFSFTPKAGVQTKTVKKATGTPTGTAALPPFSSCEASLGGAAGTALPIALSAPPLFSVTINPSLDLLFTPENGFERFLVRAEPRVAFAGGINVTAAFTGSIACEVELFVFRIPVGGPLSLVFSGLVPVGVGVKAAGTVTVATMGISSTVEATANAVLGVSCPAGTGCEFVRSLTDFALTYTPTVDLPSIGDQRVEPSLSAFGFAKASIGNPILKALRFDAFEFKAGGELSGSFAPLIGQISDTSYKSDYGITLKASAGPGTELSGALGLLGLSSISAFELVISQELAHSPTGSVSADRTTFSAGDMVRFFVDIDPATKDFFPGLGPYNIERLQLVRKNGLQTTMVASVNAQPGQTSFELGFVASDFGSTSEFTVFAVTALLPLDVLALEVGAPAQTRIDAALPAQISAPTVMVITVTKSDGSGGFVPFANAWVEVTASCGTVSPDSGLTDGQGHLTVTVTPAPGCTTVSVTVVAKSAQGGSQLAEQNATTTFNDPNNPPAPPDLPNLSGSYSLVANNGNSALCGGPTVLMGTGTATMSGATVTLQWVIDTLSSPVPCDGFASNFPRAGTLSGTLVRNPDRSLRIVGAARLCGGVYNPIPVFTTPRLGIQVPEISCTFSFLTNAFFDSP